ncbi:hypothetical protein PROFUN_07587 [Planoprotostelium fungivorum]|uniref:Biogenesis of lysosome-related organelles complex 1 subunit 2 n=1 Tax=Planoprotostelium fungivorum TaxID=1890364 RepID=A0A2P6NLW5_9EUKA|nr:hypothetical protein PROFUN_07587 [Planoprotostelium fungivorum]
MSNVSSPATLKAGNESNEPSDSLVNATRTMFTNVATYIKGEFDATSEDLMLLEAMNKCSRDKYTEMAKVVQNLNAFMEDYKKKQQELEPYLNKLEQVGDNLAELEHTAILLDEYTKRLEEKFKKLAIAKREARRK